MNAPDTRARLAAGKKRRKRPSKAFLTELRRQCRLANRADRHDNWQQYLKLPE